VVIVRDLETLACAAQIPHLSSSCRRGTAKTSPQGLAKSCYTNHPKGTFFDGETLTRATRLDEERELQLLFVSINIMTLIGEQFRLNNKAATFLWYIGEQFRLNNKAATFLWYIAFNAFLLSIWQLIRLNFL